MSGYLARTNPSLGLDAIATVPLEMVCKVSIDARSLSTTTDH